MQITTSLTHITLSKNEFDDTAAIFFAEAIMVSDQPTIKNDKFD